MEKHMATINGTVAETAKEQAAIKATVYGRGNDKGLAGDVDASKRKSDNTSRELILMRLLFVATIAGLVGLGVINWKVLSMAFG